MLDGLFGDRKRRQEMAELKARWEALLTQYNQLNEQLLALQQDRDRLQRRVQTLEQENKQLRAQLEEAQRAGQRPVAPFRRRERVDNPKPPGRPKGHKAAHCAVPQEVDQEVYVPLDRCPHCGATDLNQVIALEPQVVIDIPDPIPRVVKRYHNQSGYCPRCRRRVQSRHPDQTSGARGAAGVQLGPRAVAAAVDIKHRVGVPFRKVSEILLRLCRIPVCAGAQVRMGQRVAPRCEPTYQAVIEVVRAADVVNVDETGWYITQADRKPWLWVFTTPEPKVTLYVIRLSRGIEVPLEILGEEFIGTMGIDGWAAFLNLPYDKGQCLGHLLRRCHALLEVNKQGAARFPLAVKHLLQEAIAVKHLQPQLDPTDYRALVEQVRGQMDSLLGGHITQADNLRLANHLATHQDELFTCLDVPLLGATNNLAEREIRPAVVLRKISAGNRTLEGAYVHEHLATLSRTAERNGVHLIDVMPALLKSPDPHYVLPLVRDLLAPHRAMPP